MREPFNHKKPFEIGDTVFIDKNKTVMYDDNDRPRKIKDFQFRPYEGYFALLEGLNKYVHIDCLTSVK